MAAAGGSKTLPTVVILDDSDSLRALTRRALGRAADAGRFRVVEVSDAEACLAAIELEQSRGSPVLLLSDNQMPGKAGSEVVLELAARFPATRLQRVLMTSSEPPETLSKRLTESGARVLIRPFDLTDLVSVLDRIVADWLHAL